MGEQTRRSTDPEVRLAGPVSRSEVPATGPGVVWDTVTTP